MATQAEINQNALSTDHLLSNLGSRAVRGGIIAVSAQPIRLVLQFVATAIMARLLAPDDFGLVAMAATVTGFVSIFSDLGLSAATVQRDKIDQDTVSGLFLANIGIGLLLVPVACLAAPVAAWFFKDPRVTLLIVALSLTLPIAAMGAQHTAILVRSMRWMTIQWTGLAGHAAGAVAGVIAAWVFHLGYWSLVVTAWTATIVTVATIWMTCRWRPTRVKDWNGARGSLHFGLHLTGFSVTSFFQHQLDNILIGWRSGTVELGFYARGYQLMMMPNTIFLSINSAMEPSLARLQNEPERWRKAFLEGLALLTLLASGMAAVLVACADPLIALLYGPQWVQSAPIFQWLAASIFAGVTMNATHWIFMSLGRTRRLLIWSLMLTPILAGGFLLGLPQGAVGVARAYTVVTSLALVPCFAFATRGSPVKLIDTMAVILPMLATGVVAGLVGLALPLQQTPTLLRLVLGGGATGLTYLVFASAFIATGEAHRPLRERIIRMTGAVLLRTRSLI